MGKLLLFMCMLSFAPLAIAAAGAKDCIAMGYMKRVADNLAADTSGVESLNATLYVRERVEVDRMNVLLNVIPNMTRFDRGEKSYVAELLYDVSCIYNSLPQIRRVASNSTFRRSSGEMDKVLSFITPQISGERLFGAKHLSPLYPTNMDYYSYSVDSLYANPGFVKVLFKSRFDNIQLFPGGWVVVREADMLPSVFYAEGWDEQCSFSVECRLGEIGLERYVVRDIRLSIDYGFALNKLVVGAVARFDYSSLQERHQGVGLAREYDLSVGHGGYKASVCDGERALLTLRHKLPLPEADSLLFAAKGVNRSGERNIEPVVRSGSIMNMLWQLGDGAVSSHSLAWGSSDLKMSPVLNPSCLSYSTNRGLAYKLSFRFRKHFSSNKVFEIRPLLGYSFKHKEVYWSVAGSLGLNPMKRSAFLFDVGRGSSLYSSIMLDEIEKVPLDSLRFSSMPFVYYRDFHVKGNFQFEIANGLELQAGANFYKRSMSGNALGLEVEGVELKKYYRQFAPHIRLTWHPGMYYYISNGSKVNLGSRSPRFALDVEQGTQGLFGSYGTYTRAELDMQYMNALQAGASLYLRLGVGGYFRTNDVYFVSYAFLKDNNLPLDKDDELSGAFQLLDSRWYNSANKYLRASLAYESPFLFMQKMMPSVGFIKSEALYANILFISHLRPYIECGYGVDTPYVNAGLFLSFENYEYSRIGFKIAFSLFQN